MDEVGLAADLARRDDLEQPRFERDLHQARGQSGGIDVEELAPCLVGAQHATLGVEQERHDGCALEHLPERIVARRNGFGEVITAAPPVPYHFRREYMSELKAPTLSPRITR